MIKYYTCFKFDQISHDDLHVTHKYLGLLDSSEEAQVIKIIDRYFMEYQNGPFNFVFDKVAYFGKNEDIRVLVSDKEQRHYLWGLRTLLDEFFYIKGDYSYCPHVTTDKEEKVDKKAFEYCLIRDGIVIKSWKL